MAERRSHWWWTVPGCLAMVLLNAAVSYGIVRLNAPVTVAFNMKQTVDAFFDRASQKQLSEAQSKALSARFNTALEASLQAWQQKHHAVILVSPAVVSGILKSRTSVCTALSGPVSRRLSVVWPTTPVSVVIWW
ncbi:TPA: type-F conjugative transfer system protein TrbI [Escherichia coli]|nr:type-F conjugative transfer system protein TrbI [Escherichia coli]EEV7807882.1 type-F conjugative transfer system protein TrbI [Escherichia coli]HAN9157977.1 type-F conjugative transfer system protein TrbI [Escherichia coli]HBC3259381.1 type-F conjugative transfer system protein TrbI [Escherichia coli]HCT7188217.1 type-F conjugative transfer system protein TrbI [Escherichia coli]